MIRSLIRLALVGAIGATLALGTVAPAHATVHEIVAQWCSGHEPLEPHGLSRDGSTNFARPLAASGFLEGPVPYEDGFLLKFNFDNPNSKVVGSGIVIVIGEIEGAPLYLELPAPNPDFPAFKHCPRLAGA